LVYALTTQLDLLERMIYLRSVDQFIADHYKEQEMRCPTHLSIGQEGPAAAIGIVLRNTDYAISTHRGHYHYLAKGGDLNAMAAELYGRVTGCARGRGGSMHLIDENVGFKGTTAIVGNSIPIGTGLGLAQKLNGGDGIAVVFLGDAAVETGSFWESVNFAATQKLPVLYLCENNLYSVYTPMGPRQPEGRKIHEMAAAMGLIAFHGDGNNAEEALSVLEQAVGSIRSGKGPALVEFSTYRWREHCGPDFDNTIGYRSEEEFLEWKGRDPIRALEENIADNAHAVARIEAFRIANQVRIETAFSAAKAAPWPPIEEGYVDEYAVAPGAA
jgi:pyruvate dehydrogenase E1 component alpha subunit